MNNLSQNQMIEKHLNEGNSLTPLEALKLFGCFRLSGRIYDLKRRGVQIKTDIISTLDGKRVASYHL
jgi:hypothetical protein